MSETHHRLRGGKDGELLPLIENLKTAGFTITAIDSSPVSYIAARNLLILDRPKCMLCRYLRNHNKKYDGETSWLLIVSDEEIPDTVQIKTESEELPPPHIDPPEEKPEEKPEDDRPQQKEDYGPTTETIIDIRLDRTVDEDEIRRTGQIIDEKVNRYTLGNVNLRQLVAAFQYGFGTGFKSAETDFARPNFSSAAVQSEKTQKKISDETKIKFLTALINNKTIYGGRA